MRNREFEKLWFHCISAPMQLKIWQGHIGAATARNNFSWTAFFLFQFDYFEFEIEVWLTWPKRTNKTKTKSMNSDSWILHYFLKTLETGRRTLCLWSSSLCQRDVFHLWRWAKSRTWRVLLVNCCILIHRKALMLLSKPIPPVPPPCKNLNAT